MQLYVPAALKGWHDVQRQRDDHEAYQADLVQQAERATPPHRHPPTCAVIHPKRGSRLRPDLLALAAAGKRAATSLEAPATLRPSPAATAWAPTINILTSGMGAFASSFSKALAQGVNPAEGSVFETNAMGQAAQASKPNVDALTISARIAGRQRKNLERIMGQWPARLA